MSQQNINFPYLIRTDLYETIDFNTTMNGNIYDNIPKFVKSSKFQSLKNNIKSLSTNFTSLNYYDNDYTYFADTLVNFSDSEKRQIDLFNKNNLLTIKNISKLFNEQDIKNEDENITDFNKHIKYDNLYVIIKYLNSINKFNFINIANINYAYTKQSDITGDYAKYLDMYDFEYCKYIYRMTQSKKVTDLNNTRISVFVADTTDKNISAFYTIRFFNIPFKKILLYEKNNKYKFLFIAPENYLLSQSYKNKFSIEKKVIINTIDDKTNIYYSPLDDSNDSCLDVLIDNNEKYISNNFSINQLITNQNI